MKNNSTLRPSDEHNRGGHGSGQFLTAMGLFSGQSDAFFTYLTGLATAADAAMRGV